MLLRQWRCFSSWLDGVWPVLSTKLTQHWWEGKETGLLTCPRGAWPWCCPRRRETGRQEVNQQYSSRVGIFRWVMSPLKQTHLTSAKPCRVTEGKPLGLERPCSLYFKNSALPFFIWKQLETIVNKWAWLCANCTLFTDTKIKSYTIYVCVIKFFPFS